MARIFTALLLPEDVVAHLDEHIDGVRTAHPHLRWVHPRRWHLTLEFLGECGRHEVDRQVRRWSVRAGRCPPLNLRLRGAGTFPEKAWVARVLWAGLAGDLDAWNKLAGYRQESHVTLARTRERTDLTNLVSEMGSYAGPWWRAEDVVLMESHLGRGARYVPVETFPFTGSFAAPSH